MSARVAPNSSELQATEVVAAVDLGSNSFHMVIARSDLGKLRILDKMRERVRLAEGLRPDGTLEDGAQERAMACLERFGERLRDMAATHVRVVGTNTLRSARNSSAFLPRLTQAIGHPIDIISGREEARLIYLGVSHDVEESARKRLVVDIGGGSTECIVGERLEPLRADSLHMGCVTYTHRFFPNGKIRAEYFRNAELAAAIELRSIKRVYRRLGWDQAVGSSGTIASVHETLRANEFVNGITWPGLEWLRKSLIASGRTSRLELAGLDPDRQDILPGGLAILAAVFRSLKLERMDVSGGALREGVLYDLLGRTSDDDIRERTVTSMAERYGVDKRQAARVEKTAIQLLDQLKEAWQLDGERATRFISWAAQLHEIGLALAYAGYHRHGEYLLEHSDMPGFSRGEQRALARLVRTHRRRLKPDLFEDLPVVQQEFVQRLAVVLRLAVALNRSRSEEELPKLHLYLEDDVLRLEFPRDWLDRHPMTRLELEREAQRYRALDLRFRWQ